MTGCSAILMGGQHPDGAYWYHNRTGSYVTSSYYATSYPQWVAEFNESGRAARYYGREWTRLLPEDQYGVSREDAFAAEGDGEQTTFTGEYCQLSAAGNQWLHWH